jgi:6-pyruvoyl-tetrahydropterin synthase
MEKSTASLTSVFCRTRFVAFHRWKDAPEKFKYLSAPHRHEFHVTVEVSVSHDNRDVEFIELRDKVDYYIHGKYGHSDYKFPTGDSCEMMCDYLAFQLSDLEEYYVKRIEVSEDGENGAIKYYE